MNWPPVRHPYRALLWALIVTWVVLVPAGFIFGPMNNSGSKKIPLAICMVCTFIVAVCGGLWWLALSRPLKGYAALIGTGMLFGFLGDLAMGHVVIIPGLDPMILGMVWFGLCHTLYISGYVRLGRILDARRPSLQVAAVFLVVALGLLSWWLLVQSPDTSAARNYGALIYATFISIMGGFALSLTLHRPRMTPLFVGAALLLASDILLGNFAFRHNRRPLCDDVVWVMYNIGQGLIVFSSGYAIRVLQDSEAPSETPEGAGAGTGDA